jgi:type I restriction enzyme, S subunit
MISGWSKKKLQDVCKLFTDGNWIESKDQATEGIRLIQTGNIGQGEYREKGKNARYISEETFKRLKCTEIFAGDLLVSRLPEPVGRSCIIPDIRSRMITAVDCTIIRPKHEIQADFLKYYQISNAYLKDVDEKTTGMTRSRISRKNLGLITIPIPPLPEQKRIVAKLDQAFEAIDKARANVERNLQNAKDLFQSQLNKIFSQKGDGWIERVLNDIGQIQTGTTPPTKDKSNYGNFIPFVKPSHFNSDGTINAGDCMLSKSGLSNGRLFPAYSVLMVCIGATIGKTGFSEEPVSANQQINCLTPTEEHNPKLFYFGLISPFVQKQVADIGKGAQATLPIINKSKWQKLKINIPVKKSIQDGIVIQLNELRSQAVSLEKKYLQEYDALNELKKSILQKAFNGEL